jgi:hypothetical protein
MREFEYDFFFCPVISLICKSTESH